MDLLTILLIVLAVAVVAAIAFVAVRRRQRSSSVLAAPGRSTGPDGGAR